FGGNEFRQLVERLNHVSSGGQNAFRHLLKSCSLSLAVDRSKQASELALYRRIRNERERQSAQAFALPKAIRETFRRRKTHYIPFTLPLPPLSWSGPFSEMEAECSLEPDMEKHFGVVAQFFSKLNLCELKPQNEFRAAN